MHTLRKSHVATATVALLACTALASEATRALSATTAGTSMGELVKVSSQKSLLGTHTLYRETFHGLPVLDAYYAVHVVGGRQTIDDGRVAVRADLARTPKIAAANANSRAKAALPSVAKKQVAARGTRLAKQATVPVKVIGGQKATLSVVGGSASRLVWRVVDSAANETIVDAMSGSVTSVRSLLKNRSGSGQVFNPNPVASTGNENLRDQKDSATAVPKRAYKSVPLRYLDLSGSLHGSFATTANPNHPRVASLKFDYDRSNDYFEQVSAYYDITTAQEYLQHLGFRNVNQRPQAFLADAYSDDNSDYDPAIDRINFGQGGVDDAEDDEVVWHEYGHAIQDAQVRGFGQGLESSAIGEGFGDYWAVTMSQPVSNGFDLPCVADWDSTSYTQGVPQHCLRRVDTDTTMADFNAPGSDEHDNGRIWSRALWDIHQALGRRHADTVIIESQFSYAPDTSFSAAAQHVIDAAQALYGTTAANACRAAFQARLIL